MFIVVRPKKDDLRPLSLYYCLVTKLNLSVLTYKLISELNLKRIPNNKGFDPFLQCHIFDIYRLKIQ